MEEPVGDGDGGGVGGGGSGNGGGGGGVMVVVVAMAMAMAMATMRRTQPSFISLSPSWALCHRRWAPTRASPLPSAGPLRNTRPLRTIGDLKRALSAHPQLANGSVPAHALKFFSFTVAE